MALLLAIFMAFGLGVGGSVVALLLAITPAGRPHAAKWFSILAGTGFGGAAATFGLVYLWEMILKLEVSEDAFFVMLALPAFIIFFGQIYLFYGREEKKISPDGKGAQSNETNSHESQNT